MVTTQVSAAAANASLSGFPTSNKHCVFRCSDAWFSVPAISVREIVMVPEMVRVPKCHPALAGLGRLRSEFVPVITMGALLDMEQADDSTAFDRLLVFEGNSIWSLLISESPAIESMETIVSQEAHSENANNIILGTAMFKDRIVRVLNPNALLKTAQQVFEEYWIGADG